MPLTTPADDLRPLYELLASALDAAANDNVDAEDLQHGYGPRSEMECRPHVDRLAASSHLLAMMPRGTILRSRRTGNIIGYAFGSARFAIASSTRLGVERSIGEHSISAHDPALVRLFAANDNEPAEIRLGAAMSWRLPQGEATHGQLLEYRMTPGGRWLPPKEEFRAPRSRTGAAKSKGAPARPSARTSFTSASSLERARYLQPTRRDERETHRDRLAAIGISGRTDLRSARAAAGLPAADRLPMGARAPQPHQDLRGGVAGESEWGDANERRGARGSIGAEPPVPGEAASTIAYLEESAADELRTCSARLSVRSLTELGALMGAASERSARLIANRVLTQATKAISSALAA